jgi:hypothetical protein
MVIVTAHDDQLQIFSVKTFQKTGLHICSRAKTEVSCFSPAISPQTDRRFFLTLNRGFAVYTLRGGPEFPSPGKLFPYFTFTVRLGQEY